jgi:lipopolysaccharide/colanic/teichoic acid biosynthesis glycosyltransferase
MTGGPSRDVMLACKRVFDVVATSILLVLTSPLMIAIAIAIVVDSPGTPLFVQTRAGRFGRPFRIYKFRSMVPRAEDDGPVLTMKDRRVTRVGRFLRRTSLDELPQLLNVLQGDMSLVGPRPQLIGTTRPGEERRFDMRPGLTGLVEVSHAHLLSWDERMQLDIEYVERWTFRLDLWILLKTIPIVFVRKDILDLPRTSPDGTAPKELP